MYPTDEWMQQQARNASMWAEDEGIDVRFLIHDRDTKFTGAFDRHFRRDDGDVVLTGPHFCATQYSVSTVGLND